MTRSGTAVEIVLHLPKCAGSTVEDHLERHLPRGAFWKPEKRTRHLPLELLGRKYALDPPGPPAAVRAVTGHYLGRSVERLFAGRPLRRSVLMRAPQALLVSWYNYRMLRYLAQGRAAYPFALHLESLPPDPMAHFLLAHWLELPWGRLARMSAVEKLARLEEALAGFDLVGDVSDCDRLVAELSARLGLPPAAEGRNTGEDWQAEVGRARGFAPLRAGDLTAAERALLARRTALDAALHARLVRGAAHPFAEADAAPFLAAELRRPLAELRRRWRRGGPRGPALETPETRAEAERARRR